MYVAIMATNSITLLLLLSISCLCSTKDVYIQQFEGENCPGTPCYDITTFGEMADNFSNSTGLVVRFLEGSHLLDLQEVVVFTNLTNAVFEGAGRMVQGFHETVWQSTAVIECTQNSSTGIAFINSANITFRYVTITNCGADMTSFCRSNLICNGSLGYFKMSYNIAIDHVSIQNGTGNGLLIDTDGTNLMITDSSFVLQNHWFIPGYINEDNIAIVYSDPLNCDPQSYEYNMLVLNTNVSFGNEGITIHLLQRSYIVDILFDSVIAHDNDGNVYIIAAEHNVPTYSLTINNLLSSSATTYGSLLIECAPKKMNQKQCPVTQKTTLDFNINILNSEFRNNNNYDDNGGIVSITLFGVKFTTKINIQSTKISHNNGRFILKMDILSSQYQSQCFVTLENFIANNNTFELTLDFLSSSAIITNFVTALVLKNVSIANNSMTGLTVFQTTVEVMGTSIFHNNIGSYDGGGLSMHGSSYLLLHEHSILNFTNNRAMDRGGAIFVDTCNDLEKAPCFFQFSDNTLPQSVTITMTGNTAGKAGTALFGGNINECILFLNSLPSGSEWFNKTFEYSAQTGLSVISSEPNDVCFCDDNNTINCSRTWLKMTAYPGEEISISVTTVGQLNGIVPGILQIYTLSLLATSTEVHNTRAMNCTTIALKPIYNSYSFRLFNTSFRKYLDISFLGCPFGFELSNKTRSCDCEKLKLISTTITCNAATKMLTRQGDIWIGNISDCVTVQTPCPFQYCNSAQVSFSLTDPDPQCALNRTGILCGTCKQNLSLALGSNNCIQCPEFSYLALIIPFAAAGFGLVALLMVLNLTVSIGTINGLIFYASIVKMSESTGIFFPNGPIPVLSQFIAWLNLDLGIETCFYHGMTAYVKSWLQFAFPLYIWFIIATIIVLCRYSTWLSNKIGGNVVQVLATLILLSFTKIFHTAVLAIKFTTLSCSNSGRIIARFVWSMDGTVPYFSLKHSILMVAAVLFLLLAVPYTLALLFDAVIEKYLTRIMYFRKQWIKFKPFVDAYHGPYKDNCRFWTGLLLLVRMTFTLVSLHLSTYIGLIFITTSTSVLLSLMVFHSGVYQKNNLNILEWSSLINLIVLSGIYSSLLGKSDAQQVVTIISVSVAFTTFIGVIVFHCVKKIKCFNKFFSNNSEESERLFKDEENLTCQQQLEQPTSSDVWLRRESLIY